MSNDILLRGGTVYDGAGNPGVSADVLISKGRIAAIGDGLAAPDATVIDASGLAVAPGFIDIKTHSDFTLPINPKAESKVQVHYTGWTTDGKMFDSSVARGQPATFPLNAVIAGWTEGVQLMVEGEKRRFWIPQDLAYKGADGPPKGMLVFDVELLEIEGN